MQTNLHIFCCSVTKPLLLIVVMSIRCCLFFGYVSFVSCLCIVICRFSVFVQFSCAKYGRESRTNSAVGVSLCVEGVCSDRIPLGGLICVLSFSCDLRDVNFLPEHYNIFIIYFILCFRIFSPIGHHP